MAKRTKSQNKRLIQGVLTKSEKLFIGDGFGVNQLMTQNEFMAIHKIYKAMVKRLG